MRKTKAQLLKILRGLTKMVEDNDTSRMTLNIEFSGYDQNNQLAYEVGMAGTVGVKDGGQGTLLLIETMPLEDDHDFTAVQPTEEDPKPN